jgi:hypothetical protein
MQTAKTDMPHIHTMLRTDNAKLVADCIGEGLQLFDMTADPDEQIKLIDHCVYHPWEMQLRDRLLRRLLISQMILSEKDHAYTSHTFVTPVVTGQLTKD